MIKQLPYVAIALLVVGVVVIVAWPTHDKVQRGEPMEWVFDEEEGGGAGILAPGPGTPQEGAPGIWNQFLGPELTNWAPDDGVKLATSWAESGPREVWSRNVGNGHAGVAIFKGRVYMIDYDADLFPDPENNNQPRGGDIIRCMSLADGQDIWTYSYPVTSVNNHGVSRPSPAVNDKYLVAHGPKCELTVLDVMTGELKWTIDTKKQYGAKVPKWYAGQSALLEGDHVIMAPSGKAGSGVESKDDVLAVKFKAETGEVVWEAENTLGSIQTHVSLVPMDLHGTRVYIYSGSQGLSAIEADSGEVIWDSKLWFNKIANCANPVPLPDNRLFLSAGYGSGSMMMQINKGADGRLAEEVLWTKPEKEFGSVQHTPLFDPDEQLLYGIRVNGEFICMDLDGTFRWTSGKDKGNKYGIGPYLASQQGLIYALDGHGRLDLLRVNSSKFDRLASAHVMHNKDAWGPMALAGGRLIARDIKRLVCLDVSDGGAQ